MEGGISAIVIPAMELPTFAIVFGEADGSGLGISIVGIVGPEEELSSVFGLRLLLIGGLTGSQNESPIGGTVKSPNVALSLSLLKTKFFSVSHLSRRRIRSFLSALRPASIRI